MKRFSAIAAAAAVVCTAALFSVPGFAAENAVIVTGMAPTVAGGLQTKAVKVGFADLDLATGQGAALLLDRIHAASRLVCGERSGLPMMGDRAKAFAACQARATAVAVEAVNAPALTQAAAR